MDSLSLALAEAPIFHSISPEEISSMLACLSDRKNSRKMKSSFRKDLPSPRSAWCCPGRYTL